MSQTGNMCFTLQMAAALLAGATCGSPALAAEGLAIEEWPVPWEETRPRDPDVADDGRIWFVGQRGDYVAVLDPDDGDMRKLALPDGTGPHNLIVEGDDTIWYAGNRAAHIGRLDGGTGAIEKIPMPNARAKDPHTLVFDDAGDIWFTVQGGNFIGKLAVDDRSVTLIDVPTPSARPYGIVVAPDGTVWATEFGTNKLARIDPDSMSLTEVELPRDDARPRRLVATTEGVIYYVDYAGGYLGRFDPADGTFEEWPTPSGPESRPYGMAIDAKDRIWFVETGPEPNRFVGFDPDTESFIDNAAIDSGGGAVRHMVYDPQRNSVWFGTDTNTIGRAILPE